MSTERIDFERHYFCSNGELVFSDRFKKKSHRPIATKTNEKSLSEQLLWTHLDQRNEMPPLF